ncbi:glycosyltransferase family 2 protein [Dechloromonas sp. ARDL1]|uniref:glycosyltransferase family 2 protein n=1 Tax=Dechloromonas sp. ARDL1 TaxID=3322121 RepID=UPI003DA74FC6
MVAAQNQNPQPALAVLMACHNRREKTVECLRRLTESAQNGGLEFALYLFDDGSTDGTAEAVRSAVPLARILHGDGNQFWNRSMHHAFAEALRNGHQLYLWLNDDTMLTANALGILMETSLAQTDTQDNRPIVVGAICDPQQDLLTYGGGKRPNPVLRPFFYRLLTPNGTPQEVDVMNGNVVLIPHCAAQALGNLDPVFEHGMGDTDYSLRARRSGRRIVLTPEYIGMCSRNPLAGTFHDKTASVAARVRFALSRKGLPWRSWLAMCSRHGNVLWPIHFIWGYLRILMSARGS